VPFLRDVALGRRDKANHSHGVKIIAVNMWRQVHFHPTNDLTHKPEMPFHKRICGTR
jgi:mannose-6-phosphate isomerase class I